ncbi:adenine nucleotide translocase lysine N-methyltransferase [Fundulus diaphanus]
MMASEKEKDSIRRFVKGQLRDGPDLSTLTLGILKKRYLAQEGCESLRSEAKQFMKQVVGEELSKMQESDGGESEPEINKPKRKREREKEELESDAETESAAKKSRSGHKDSPSDSEDEENCETGSQNKEQTSSRSTSKEEESEHEKSKKTGQRVTSDESSDEEIESENGRNENLSPKEKVKQKANTAKNGATRSVDSGGRNTTTKSNKESESDADRSSEKIDSSADDKENGKKGSDSDSDSSSSLPSVDDEKKSSPAEAKDKKQKKTKTGGSKDEEKAVVRLKRYIALCGAWRNYRKLLDGCRSTRSKVAVLKQELKDLGVHGNPSIEKCKKIRLKREEAQELAELDVNNIITTEGLHIGGWGVLQIAAGTGLAVYAMWAGVLQPGFRKVPLRLQVPYIPASKAQVKNVMTLMRGRTGGLVDLGSGDGRIVLEASHQSFSPVVGYELNPWLVQLARFHAWRAGRHGNVSYRQEDLWKVDLSKCKNVTVFLAPSVLSLLQKKLHAELPDDALVVAGRFPFPDWNPCRIEGQGVDRAWAYNMQAQRPHGSQKNESLSTTVSDVDD